MYFGNITEEELIIPLVFPGFEVWKNFFQGEGTYFNELEDISYIIHSLDREKTVAYEKDNSDYIKNLFEYKSGDNIFLGKQKIGFFELKF